LPPATPATVVRHPVDCLFSDPVPVARNREFVFIGRMETEKGATLFARAVRASGVPATFIGDGALRPELQRLCPEAHFTGWLAPAKIRWHLERARVLVFPPLWYETLGLVVIEAAAAGVPALVSDGCAATDYIRSGHNGLHFARGSVASLSRQMTALARDDEKVGRLGRAAYDWYWEEPWTSARHVAELLEIYREITGVVAPPVGEGTLHESAVGD
jgi:glycosyltransferase involved in cell wall biosynthesis